MNHKNSAGPDKLDSYLLKVIANIIVEFIYICSTSNVFKWT